MSSGFSRLPQELVDSIVDHLHSDEASLKHCALVCRSWLPASRVHLFARIHLELCTSQHARLLAVLERTPEIAVHVHELRLDIVGLEGAMALPALGHLRRVELTGAVHWDALDPPLRRAIEALFRQPSITYVRLAKWTFESWDRLSALFRHTPHLRGLALRDIEFCSNPSEMEVLGEEEEEEVEEGEEEDGYTPPRPEFVTLDFVDCHNMDHWPDGPMDMSQIREFRLGHSDALGGDKLLHACGRSLERFHLKPGSGDTESLKPAPISLRHCTTLRSLRLTLEDYPDILGWVVDMISSLTVPCTLEHVAIEFFIDPKKLTHWDAIDAVLSRFDSLKQVAIGVFAQHTQPEFLRVQDDMECLRERGVLRVYELARRNQNQKLCYGLTPMISSFEE